LISLFVVVLLVVGCDKEPALYTPALPDATMDPSRVVMPDDPDDGAIELPKALKTKILENCLIVRDAIERFALENGGYYPSDSCDMTPAVDTFIDLLPEGMLLENPVYLCRIEPVDGAAAIPGQTGYVCAVNSEGQATGYLITGFGLHDEIVQLYKDPNDD
jgi:hypothetical protein